LIEYYEQHGFTNARRLIVERNLTEGD
jgi:hypothetical protein